MPIPTEFQLGGTTWKVVLRKRLKGRFGDCDMKRQQIQILDTLPEDVKDQTFYHELTHAIQIAMGYNTDDHDEVFTDNFAVFLHQFMKTAKYP
jgi:hypothetical protein